MDITAAGIKQLLKDIDYFLNETLREENLSEHATTEKDGLRRRLASQLAPTYLDMNGAGKAQEQTEPVEEYVGVDPVPSDEAVDPECYEQFPEKQLDPPLPQMEEDKCQVDYENIPLSFSKLREEAKKFGCLYRKEKFLFIEHLMRCWAGIKHDILYIYNNERDTKPSTIILLKDYCARSAPSYYNKDTKKRECCFEIVCPGKKTYQFIARTVKDKEQWISAVCDAGQGQLIPVEQTDSTIASLPPSSSSAYPEEDYDDIRTQDSSYVNEDIYNDISDYVAELQATEVQAPPAPIFRRPVPDVPHEDSFDRESAVYDDIDNLRRDDVYYNCMDKSGELQESDSVPRSAIGNEYVDDVDIYDDIGDLNISDKETQKGPFNQDETNSPGRIHQLIQKMQASLGNNQKPIGNNVSTNNQASDSNIPSEEYYEPIDVFDDIVSKPERKPTIPPRTNCVRF